MVLSGWRRNSVLKRWWDKQQEGNSEEEINRKEISRKEINRKEETGKKWLPKFYLRKDRVGNERDYSTVIKG